MWRTSLTSSRGDRPWRIALILVALSMAAPVAAQESGNGFLFGEPAVQFTLRAGYPRSNASSNLFTDATRDLTLGRSAFDGVTGGAEFAVRITPQFDVAIGVDFADKRTLSHYRYFVDNKQREIEQTTRYQRVPVTASARWYPTSRGRSVGKLAWIPARVAPWVGAGAGTVRYRFLQEGDFVAAKTGAVYPDKLEATGWRPAALGMGGFDMTLTPRIALTADARYLWASAETLNGSDYVGYTIDPSGVSATLGLTLRL